jgi:hypothetical protein
MTKNLSTTNSEHHASPRCSYAALAELPQGFVALVRKFNPYITDLELSR